MIGAVVQRVTSPVFVGREAEVDALLAALGRAESGSASTVLVGGEAGIGKTRLLSEFERLGRERGAIVLEGACIGLGADDVLPFAPIAAALRALVRDPRPRRARRGRWTHRPVSLRASSRSSAPRPTTRRSWSRAPTGHGPGSSRGS